MIIPTEVLDQHVAILGKTRSGKSSAMRLLVESLLKRKLPVCIVDPKGDWWGIKLSADGAGPGFPVVIFGGEHADVPITEHVGADVAELFATGNRSMLIDLGGWTVGARTRFWIDFASTLFKHTKGQRWLAVDEFHNFAPKGKVFDADAGKMLHWSNRLASEGLGKGLSLLFASQRPQKVHNDALTSAETLIAMRVLHPADRNAIADWIKGCGDGSGNDVINGVANLERGQGWVWSPEYKVGPKIVTFPLFSTYDSFRPQSVADTKRLKGWADVDLAEVTARFAKQIETRKANDPSVLKQRIAVLEKELKAKPSLPAEKPEVALTDADRKLLEKLRVDLDTISGHLGDRSSMLLDHMEQRIKAAAAKALEETIFKGNIEFTKAREAFMAVVKSDGFQRVLDKLSTAGQFIPPVRAGGSLPNTRMRQAPAPRRGLEPPAGADGPLPSGERAVLIAAAQHGSGITREQASILTGYKRSTRDAYIQRLKERGYVDFRYDGLLIATDHGIAALGSDYEPLPTGKALRSCWLNKLPEGEAAILNALIAMYPQHGNREELGERTGYKRSTRDAYIQRLKTRQLITISRDGVSLHPTMSE